MLLYLYTKAEPNAAARRHQKRSKGKNVSKDNKDENLRLKVTLLYYFLDDDSQVKRDFSNFNSGEESKEENKYDKIVITKLKPENPSKVTPKGPKTFAEVVNNMNPLTEQTPRFRRIDPVDPSQL